ncbi:DUF4275 family protein [Fredinandcohnia sp. QZ13]|uniref:DUF4275 family protein n=1 Tax=Fredinandcohnia sp. QZ13 TaxID=3073144 RepID=UPI002853480E|nr:DUF4275 family protein [Fredinandcohnia sp. QZ13]MDR4889702.1 DUF4275 family protein [Fredinandcohnia sp. QZ13]
MDIFNRLRNKNMKVRELPKWGSYLRSEWESHFAGHLREYEKKAIHLNSSNGYLWHLFSYEKKEYFDETVAEDAFNNEPKSECYIFYQHWDYALLVEHAAKMNTSDLGDEVDVYVVDKHFQWTFVITHESGLCGPYFSRIEKN